MGSNKHAVYVLTITVPNEIHEHMLLDKQLRGLAIVRHTYIDRDRDLVHIKSKIGETVNMSHRWSAYQNCRNKTGMYVRV